jgi:peptide/nickel transport system permease protein
MMRSFARKILFAFFLLWIISILTFWLSKAVPGDAVMDYISIDHRGYNASFNPLEHRLAYERVAQMRGLSLPDFYFSIAPSYIPDTLSRIQPYDDRMIVNEWIRKTKDGSNSIRLFQALRQGLVESCSDRGRDLSDQPLCVLYSQLLAESRLSNLRLRIQEYRNNGMPDSTNTLSVVSGITEQLMEEKIQKRSFMPAFHWHGTQNQYHQWMTGLLLQRPVTSLIDGRDAWMKIRDALKWTLMLNGFSFLLSLGLGIMIGIWSAGKNGRTGEKVINWFLFALFALPSFWLGTLLIYFFASGEWVSLFPAGGLGSYRVADNILDRWGILFLHLFLPVVCLAVGPLAYISRQMKQSILHEYAQPYVFVLRANGVSEATIRRRHVFRNAIYPIITLAGGAIPALLSGSLIIEVIFSIPGMGRLMYTSLLARDWPVAFPVLILSAAITVFAYILTDVIYRWMDPRVKILAS